MSSYYDAEVEPELPDEHQFTPFPDQEVTDAGAYMCHHSGEPPVEHVEHPSTTDLRQEAVAAVLAARAGREDEVCIECERLVNEQVRLAWHAYVRAKVEFYRARRGRAARPVETVSLEESGLEVEIPEEDEDDEEIPVESLMVVRQIVRERVPGLRVQQAVRIVTVMQEVQTIKRKKRREPVPDATRAELARLRKATGLPLDTGLL
jgi:hypothetical protein